MIIRDNRTFRDRINGLGRDDVVVGLLNVKPAEEYLFLDLVERGVTLFPSALAQQLSRSKCLQATVFMALMVPHTFVARDRHDLVIQTSVYGREKISRVVTKQNRYNCGLGVHVWDSIEDVHNQACFGTLTYPFVVQPFRSGVVDVRVVFLDDYIEAYWRKNPHSFRNNLHCGGESGAFSLSQEQMDLCRTVLERGKMPYAHIDLMILPDGSFYLSEVNLRGGLKGAKIGSREYQKKIADIEEEFIAGFLRNREGSRPESRPLPCGRPR